MKNLDFDELDKFKSFRISNKISGSIFDIELMKYIEECSKLDFPENRPLPELFCRIIDGRAPLTEIANGLEFTFYHSPKQERNNLLADLKSITSYGRLFELYIASILVNSPIRLAYSIG